MELEKVKAILNTIAKESSKNVIRYVNEKEMLATADFKYWCSEGFEDTAIKLYVYEDRSYSVAMSCTVNTKDSLEILLAFQRSLALINWLNPRI